MTGYYCGLGTVRCKRRSMMMVIMLMIIMMTAMNLAHEYLDQYSNPLKHDFRLTNI